MRLAWLDHLAQSFSHAVGIDLGTANTLVYVKGRGIVIAEPTIVAINRKTDRIVAIGNWPLPGTAIEVELVRMDRLRCVM